MKKCRKCLVVKSVSEFTKCAASPDGLYYYCKDCKRMERKASLSVDKERERFRNWYLANQERVKLKARARQARITSIDDGTISVESIRRLFALCGNKCLKCGNMKKALSPDHIIPLSLGGSHSIFNIQPLCRGCNLSKGNRESIDYRGLTEQQIRSTID